MPVDCSPAGLPQKGRYLSGLSISRNGTAVKEAGTDTRGRLDVKSDDGRRSIGYIENGIFRKYKWHSSQHLCRKHNAIGIDKGAFHYSIVPFANMIVVTDEDTSITYRVSADDFQRHCKEDNLGWGPQLFCPLRHFQKADSAPNAPRQLPLWECDGCG